MNAEAELVKGDIIRVTIDDKFKDKCSSKDIYVDYKNIIKVLKVGSKVFIDDGLICLVVEGIGKDNDKNCAFEKLERVISKLTFSNI